MNRCPAYWFAGDARCGLVYNHAGIHVGLPCGPNPNGLIFRWRGMRPNSPLDFRGLKQGRTRAT